MERGWTFSEERIAPWPVGYAAEGCTVTGHMFTVIAEPDGKIRFALDGQPGKPIDGIAEARDGSWLTWSDNGGHVAFTGVRSGRQFVVRDGVEGPPFESVSARSSERAAVVALVSLAVAAWGVRLRMPNRRFGRGGLDRTVVLLTATAVGP